MSSAAPVVQTPSHPSLAPDPTAPAASLWLTLARGDERRLQAVRGMRLLSLGGPVIVAQLGGLQPAVRLDDGETLLIERATWLTLTAWAEAELVCLPPSDTGWRRLLDGAAGFLRARFTRPPTASEDNHPPTERTS